MTVANGEVLRVAARHYNTDTNDVINVFHYKANFAASQVDQDVIDAVMEDIDNAYGALNAYMSNTYDKIDMKFDVVEFVGGVAKITRNLGTHIWTGATYVPGMTGDVLPPGVAALVKFLTGIGKTYGRKFIAGLGEGSQNAGLWGSPTVTALGVFAANLLSDVVVSAGNTLGLGVMSARSADFVAATEADFSNPIAYQRRRRPGTGS